MDRNIKTYILQLYFAPCSIIALKLVIAIKGKHKTVRIFSCEMTKFFAKLVFDRASSGLSAHFARIFAL